tara:strand:+ start:1888 stop:2625 length:738 start_codon:yes stop_codon:yes gene_type:complete
MNLETTIKQSIREHALEEKPKECCGLLIERKAVKEIYPCRNSSEQPTQHFSINPSDYVKASARGKIKAVYHSHNSGNEKFSVNDMFNSRAHKLNYILYNTVKNSFSFFDFKKNKTFLYNRIFKIGKSDCYTIVKEYYEELGIKLEGENTLGDDWYKKNPNLIAELFKLNETNPDLPILELPPNSELKEHDVIVFEFIKGAGPNHVAVYLGDGNMIHHPRNKYPCIEALNPIYQKKMYKIYRHEGL